MPRMPLSGVRISCDTVARNFDLARLAASAAARAFFRILELPVAVGDLFHVLGETAQFAAQPVVLPSEHDQRAAAGRSRHACDFHPHDDADPFGPPTAWAAAWCADRHQAG